MEARWAWCRACMVRFAWNACCPTSRLVRIVRVCFSRCLATVAVGRFLPDIDLSAILNMST